LAVPAVQSVAGAIDTLLLGRVEDMRVERRTRATARARRCLAGAAMAVAGTGLLIVTGAGVAGAGGVGVVGVVFIGLTKFGRGSCGA
jgi:hypothetical protein